MNSTVAVRALDAGWYASVGQRARWVDLIGDYAGAEFFLVDGESLLTKTLSDPLLRLACSTEPDFQILHACYILESQLSEISRRSDNFAIVFFSDLRHRTTQIGSAENAFVSSSRCLARRLLFEHLCKTSTFQIHVFQNLEDPSWEKYEADRKPAFVLASDGGPHSKVPGAAASILIQRGYIFDLLSRGVSVASLDEVEYRDSHMMSFVYEQRNDPGAKARAPSWIWTSLETGLQELNAKEIEIAGGQLAFCQEDTVAHRTPNEISASLLHLAKSMTSTVGSVELLYLFLCHIAVTETLSVAERVLPHVTLPGSLKNVLISTFFPPIFFLGARSRVLFTPSMLDGRVFSHILREVGMESDIGVQKLLGGSAACVDNIWAEIKGAAIDLAAFHDLHHFAKEDGATFAGTKLQPRALLPFSNPILDTTLSTLRLPVGASSSDDALVVGWDSQASDTLFNGTVVTASDTSHWHNSRNAILPAHMRTEKAASQRLDEWQRRRRLRSEQFFMKSMQIHAATLTGASGAVLRQHIIPLVKKGDKSSLRPSGGAIVHKPKATGKEKPAKKTKADIIREQNISSKVARVADSSMSWWSKQLRELESVSSPSERLGRLRTVMRNEKIKSNQALLVEVSLYLVETLIREWAVHDSGTAEATKDRYTVEIMKIVKALIDSRSHILTNAASERLGAILKTLGFDQCFSNGFGHLMLADPEQLKQPLTFKPVKLFSSRTGARYDFMKISEDPIEWQLRVFGEFMDRSMDSTADPRVDFEPDAWQVRVLNAVDERSSLLVVAPTSAGKTFISFYAMERVLRESNDGIIVYVAPTKALVTQIAAEVYARFSKKLDSGSFWAIHTRDYRMHDVLKCQILVTVPEMLSILLLSPPLARTWVPRLKWIILDEIHSIGQQEGGAVWEQIILMAPCPIIGLSATVGKPEQFNEWLGAVQKTHGFKHTFIQHPHRYSHLRKFFYHIPKTSRGGSEFNPLKFIHPISTLASRQVNLPADLALEAGDVLSLYRALSHFASKSPTVQDLEPISYFHSSSTGLLRQKDILRYEADLKSEFVRLSQSDDTLRQNVVDRLLLVSGSSLASLDNTHVAPSKESFFHNLMPMLENLNAGGDLPAILFNFDRTNCEAMARKILEDLETAEEAWKASSKEWALKVAKYEAWKVQAEKEERRTRDKKEKKGDDRDTAEHDLAEGRWESTFDPDAPLEKFSFAANHLYSKRDLDEDVRSLSRHSSTQQWALVALFRGIAVHHAGMNKRYRTLVESLFRKGFLRVMISTGTLALGINAPARTCAFCGDSIFLTALTYRQCAGRAGRRGFDLLGKVVFYGISLDRVQRIILSNLPSLQGSFPLSSTLCLRFLNLLEGSQRSTFASDCIRNILSMPQIVFNGQQYGSQQLRNHFRFSLEYLQRARLIDESGQAINLFGMAAHLYAKPSNFAFAILLRRKVFHRLSEASGTDRETAKRNLIELLANLFGRRHLVQVHSSKENIAMLRKRSPSMVVLSPIAANSPIPHLADAHDVLREHEDDTLTTFKSYASAFTTQNMDTLGADVALPLSQIRFSGNGASEDSEIRQRLRKYSSSSQNHYISAFVATSGWTEEALGGIQDVARTTRSGLHLNANAVPSFKEFYKRNGRPLNAYILDFFKHGQVQPLVQANGIRAGDLWYLLQDFSLTLATIRSAMEEVFSAHAGATSEAIEPVAVDPAEYDKEVEEDEESTDAMDTGFKRPQRVNNADWRVYELLRDAAIDFDVKYRAMWA